jgi:hypothetical protein
MSYTKHFHQGRHSLRSTMVYSRCDCCGKTTDVQDIPAECNDAEIYVATLCAKCLRYLADELEKGKGKE